MRNLIATIAVTAAFLLVVEATRVQHCQTGEDFEDVTQVKVSNCEEPACKLKRKTDVNLEFKFTPESEITALFNSVHATIVGVPFPFFGVDGTDACKNMFETDGSKAECPLVADKEYIYKNSFRILDMYPKIKLTVNWALIDSTTKKSVFCFNVDAKITS